jgi:hypothetical protein
VISKYGEVFLNSKNWGFEYKCVQKPITYEYYDKDTEKKITNVRFDTAELISFEKLKKWFDHKGDVIRRSKEENDIPYSEVKICSEYVEKSIRTN